MNKSSTTVNWREGVAAIMAMKTSAEKRRYLRICGDHLEACFEGAPDRPIIDMELVFRAYLRDQGMSAGYINNLTSMLKRIIEMSPCRAFFNEHAAAWRQILIRNNENPIDKTTAAAVDYFLAFIAHANWPVGPRDRADIRLFKDYEFL
jgi:hypothetical protein